MIQHPTFVQLLFLSAVLYAVYRVALQRSRRLPLPPGPRPLPLVGNVKDLPAAGTKEWEHWGKHKDQYGPISSITVLGTTIVFLNEPEVAIELLEKRGSQHSGRPRFVFVSELSGWGAGTALSSDMPWVREIRRRIYSIIGTKSAVSKFESLQKKEVHRFLLRTLRGPEDVISNLRKEIGTVILKMTYGYNVEPHTNDPLVDAVELAMQHFGEDFLPGTWLVDMIPLLKHIPAWVPGARFQRVAKERKKEVLTVIETPFEYSRDSIREGRDEESFVSKLYSKAGPNATADEDYKIKWSAVNIYSAGADTTVSTLSTFMLAMTISPEVQRKAHEAIDRIVGTSRLPTSADRGSLPYVDAIVKECLRWHPVAPMGVPHMTMQDDVFNGYAIPKGALLMPQIWLYTHDPERYHDPMSFKPERFMADPPAADPSEYVFGFGRRQCPGRVLADASIWLTIACTLAVFDIGKELVNGKEVEPVVDFIPGGVSHPRSFRASIKARSAEHEELIHRVEVEHPWEEGSAAKLKFTGT